MPAMPNSNKKKKRKCYIGHNHYIAILMIPGAFGLTPLAPPLPAFRTNSTSTLLWHSLFCSRIFCFQSGEGSYDEYCALASFSWPSDTSKTPEKSNTGWLQDQWVWSWEGAGREMKPTSGTLCCSHPQDIPVGQSKYLALEECNKAKQAFLFPFPTTYSR